MVKLTDADQFALATLASVQGGLLPTQSRRDIKPLASAALSALAHIMNFASRS